MARRRTKEEQTSADAQAAEKPATGQGTQELVPEQTPEPARKQDVSAERGRRERGQRKERRGVVVSSAMDKTIVVRVDSVKPHPRYKKVVRRSTKFHAHDERNEANVGDVVRIVETRPLSKTKHWRLAEVIEAAR